MNITIEKVMEARGYITVAKAAALCGRHPSRVYDWLRSGYVEFIERARTKYVSVASLEKYVGKEVIEEMAAYIEAQKDLIE